jgi:TDG/mug DNA glycosylase family protein
LPRGAERRAGRLPDYIPPRCRVLFVGLNPGLRSSSVGHHFAGYSNRFWRLMVEAGFLPEGFDWTRDAELPRFGLGITNLVARPTAGIADLGPADYAAGRRLLLAKLARHRPAVAALVGIMVFRELVLERGPVTCGPRPSRPAGPLLWVLPNPSGRNAHFPYSAMLEEFRRLKRWVESAGASRPE